MPFRFSQGLAYPQHFFDGGDQEYGKPNEKWWHHLYGPAQFDTDYVVVQRTHEKSFPQWSAIGYELVPLDPGICRVNMKGGAIVISMPGSNVTVNYKFDWYREGANLYGEQADFYLSLHWEDHKRVVEKRIHMSRKFDPRFHMAVEYQHGLRDEWQIFRLAWGKEASEQSRW